MYVRATCFDLLGHPQAFQNNRLFSLSALCDPKCSQVSVPEAKVYRFYKLNWLYDGFNLLLSICYNHCIKHSIKTYVVLVFKKIEEFLKLKQQKFYVFFYAVVLAYCHIR